MIQIICGEDIINSRNYFYELKKKYLSKRFEVTEISPMQITDIVKWLSESMSLFYEKRIYFSQQINKYIGKTNKSDFLDILSRISNLEHILLIDWEDTSSRFLKIKNIGQIKEFKPSTSIFKLLDICYPGNQKVFLQNLNMLLQTENENFIFVMIHRYIKNILLAKINNLPTNMSPWQKQKLIYQAKRWSTDLLLKFYQALYKIEISNKTGTNPYGVKNSLDILSCYFL